MDATPASAAYSTEPLATLPVFFKLNGRRVVLAGGGAPAVWKAELLAAAGAGVQVYAEDPSPALLELAARLPSIAITGRRWVADDLIGAALAIGAIEDDAEATEFRAAAMRAGVPANVIDKPPFCDFQFGTIVARSPLVIGISTDGAAPVFGQAIRTRLEALLPQSLRHWAKAAKDWRPAVQARNYDFRARRRFWEVFAARALAADGDPTAADRDACFAAVDGASDERGGVVLVGCGSGRVEDVTLGAVAALQAADLVVHDGDVPPAVIGLSRREAPKLAATDEEAARARVRTLVADNKRIAWLGTGTPLTCRRWLNRRDAFAELPLTLAPAVSICPACSGSCADAGGER